MKIERNIYIVHKSLFFLNQKNKCIEIKDGILDSVV